VSRFGSGIAAQTIRLDQLWFFWIELVLQLAELVSPGGDTFHCRVMDYGRFRCRHCRKLRRKRTGDQRYCGERACQKARKNTWRREKYAQDSDYRANQRDSTNAWLGERGGSAAYHRAYRTRRKNPSPSRTVPEPSPPSAAPPLRAKRDAESAESALASGVYTLVPLQPDGNAKRDAFLVEIAVFPRGSESITNINPVATQGSS
jgi:hypothetical protein